MQVSQVATLHNCKLSTHVFSVEDSGVGVETLSFPQGGRSVSFYMRKQFAAFADTCLPCLQCAGLASTSSASGHPNAPGVPGSQPGEDCWKTCPLQQHDGPGVVKQDFDRPYNKTDLFPLLDMY